jgi:hypothetical protein
MKINIRTNDTVLSARSFGSVEALDRPGSTAVTFELADHSEGRR